MTKHINLHKTYTSIQGDYQLKLPLNIEYMIPANDSVRLLSQIEHMEYNEFCDYYICKNNKKLTVKKIVNRKSKTGYISEKTIYTCEDCSNCKYKSKCIKGHNCKTPLEERTKNLETSKLFNELRKDNLKIILIRKKPQ